MSIAQSLSTVDPFFMQPCPLCGRLNRMVVKGVYVKGDKVELYPDMGYSYCNCKSIFYTKLENIVQQNVGFQNYKEPLRELERVFEAIPSGDTILIVAPDPFFCEWGQDPYSFHHWDPRKNFILWDMESLCDEARAIGYEVIYAVRDMDVQSKTPQHMKITLRKP